jgi:glutathione S-transferase
MQTAATTLPYINLFPFTGLSTILMLFVYFWTGMKVGKARGKFGVKAPATSGPEEFNLIYRGHVNTLEQLVLILPALWLFAAWVGDLWAGLLGVVWIAGRFIYISSYAKAADKRGMGFMIGFLATAAALMGSLISIVIYMVTSL